MSNQVSRRIEYGILWLFAAVVIALLTGHNIPEYRRLAEFGVQATGTVTALTPQMHNTAGYKYSVTGREFQGSRGSWGPNPPLDEMHIGDQVVVYYDPRQPAVSVLGDPRPMLDNEITFVVLATLMMPTFIVLIMAFRNVKIRAPSTQNPT